MVTTIDLHKNSRYVYIYIYIIDVWANAQYVKKTDKIEKILGSCKLTYSYGLYWDNTHQGNRRSI